MTPEVIKRKHQDLLNNEIFLADPIAGMQDNSEFIVMTARASAGSGYLGRSPRSPSARSKRASCPK